MDKAKFITYPDLQRRSFLLLGLLQDAQIVYFKEQDEWTFEEGMTQQVY
jgi:hypothetical protein